MRSRPDADARLPAYAKLRDEIAARIGAGEWQPEEALPSENQLAREHALSVGTVRRAIEELVGEGLLERRQGLGTFLRKPAFDQTLFRFFAVRGADGEPASIPTSRLLARVRAEAPNPVAAVLGTHDVFRIERVRSLSGTPVLAEEIWIPAATFPDFDRLPDGDFGPLLYPLYLERFGVFIASAVDEVSFGEAQGRTARHLGLSEGEPVAVIERTAFDLSQRPVEWRRAWGSARHFRYRMTIR